MKKKYNLGVDSKKLVKFIESIKKDKKDKIQKDLNLTNLITFLSSNYIEFSKREIKLVKKEKKITNRTAMKKWGVPEDIAGAAVYLASDRASYTTGTTITVDGGYSIT